MTTKPFSLTGAQHYGSNRTHDNTDMNEQSQTPEADEVWALMNAYFNAPTSQVLARLQPLATQLQRQRDEARARVAELEKLFGKEWDAVAADKLLTKVDQLRAKVAEDEKELEEYKAACAAMREALLALLACAEPVVKDMSDVALSTAAAHAPDEECRKQAAALYAARKALATTPAEHLAKLQAAEKKGS